MSSRESVTDWITQLKQGNPEGARRLWERYFRQLVHLASRRLAGHPRRAADEEDVAISAFKSFCAAAEKDRFPDLNCRQDLWQILLMITERKALDLIERDNRLKRGAGRVLDEAGLGDSGELHGLDAVPAHEPDPAFAAEVADTFCYLLDRLDTEELRQIAVLRMEGHTVEEIADRIGCIPRRVDRRLQLIRRIWTEETEP